MARLLYIAAAATVAAGIPLVLGAKATTNGMAASTVASAQPKATTVKSIGVYSIFTGSYDVFIPEFLENMRTNFLPDHAKHFYIVADDADTCQELTRTEIDVECAVKEHMEWPYGTLYRWNYFRTSFHPSPAISHIFFFNANARCVDTITDDILGPHVAVLHNMFVDAAYEEASFEKNPISTAYLPPEAHLRYYGARMLGATTENFLRMCQVLDRNTQIDESNHFIAAWHDESHYNYYINTYVDARDLKVLGPEYHIPEELLDSNSKAKGAVSTPPKVVYLDKRAHVPSFNASKDPIWELTIGGKVHFGNPHLEMFAFRPSIYRALNPELADMGDEDLRQHYVANPDTPYFYETPVFSALFDAAAYMKKYGLESELQAKYHYIREGVWSEGHIFPVRGCASTTADGPAEVGAAAAGAADTFLTYPWQKGDRLEKDITRRRLEGVDVYSGTPAPTFSPTMPPTAAPNPLFQAIGQNFVCGPEVFLSTRLLVGDASSDEKVEDQAARILLVDPTPSSCYKACYQRLAPDNQNFIFNLYPINDVLTCTCCRTCAQPRSVEGAVVYGSCNAVELYTKHKPKALRKTSTLKIKAYVINKNKAPVSNLGVSITVDGGMDMSKFKTAVSGKGGRKVIRIVNGTTITWPSIPTIKGGKGHSVKLAIKPKSNLTSRTLHFVVSTFQTTPTAPPIQYCTTTKTISVLYSSK